MSDCEFVIASLSASDDRKNALSLGKRSNVMANVGPKGVLALLNIISKQSACKLLEPFERQESAYLMRKVPVSAGDPVEI